MFDYTKPFKTRSGQRVRTTNSVGQHTFVVEVFDAGVGAYEPIAFVKATGKTVGVPEHQEHPWDLVNLTIDQGFAHRSIRPGLVYKLRNGYSCQVEFTDLNIGPPLRIIYKDMVTGDIMTGRRAACGRVFPDGDDHPHDVLEVTPQITKWVRVYDQAPIHPHTGKIVVSGKEFDARRALHWYLYDTEVEAKSQLRGVRAVFPISYNEGEGVDTEPS